MAAHLWHFKPGTGRSAGALNLGRPNLSASLSSMSSPTRYWSPPPEPEKPTLPYKRGFQFTARRVKAPPPFLGQYAKVPTGPFRQFLDKARFPGKDFLRTTTLVDYCMSAASKPLPCEPLEETATFEVLQEIAVGDGPGRGGSQVFTCLRRGHKGPLVAKVYDPLYYPFADDDFPHIPTDVVVRAEHNFALESAAYAQLDQRLGGSLIPKFYGSWIFDVPLKHMNRPVTFILLEHLEGVPLNTLDPKLHTQEERLHVLALTMEAQLELHFAGVMHDDIAPRNIICSGRDLSAKDLRVRVIDFNHVTVLPLLGADAPCVSEPLPESPMEWFWRGRPVDMREWAPDAWKMSDWKQWLRTTRGGSPEFKPVPEENIPE